MGWYADSVFPWLIERLEGPEIHALRARAVRPAAGRVLEIGLGTGKTLPYYGASVTHLSVVEPSKGMNRKSARALAEAAFETEVKPIKGEELPFDAGYFDCVVCTMTLCSVDDPDLVLQEMFRVVKPGGHYHFLEHVLSRDPGVARWQHRLDPLQCRIGCGCRLTRDTEASIRRTGWQIQELERVICRDMLGFDLRMFPWIVGDAVKPNASSPT